MKLFVKDVEAVKGQEVETFHGEKAVLKHWLEPQTPNSSGHVYISFEGEDNTYEYYPSVINAKFKEG